jgi:MGT family glycosyltransferase
MSTILFTIPDFTSHVLPTLPIVEALVKRGHQVIVHTRENHAEKVSATGAMFAPMSLSCEIKHVVDSYSDKSLKWLPPFLQGLWRFRKGIQKMIPAMVTELEAIIKREDVDVLAGDYIGYGAAYAAERLEIPFITISTTWAVTYRADCLPIFLSLPIPASFVHRIIDWVFPLRHLRPQLGLPPRLQNAPAEFLSIIVSDLLHLVTVHAGFIPSVALRKNQVFIGPTDFNFPSGRNQPQLSKNLDPATVLVSTTTSSTTDAGLFRHVVESIAPMGIPILATSGNASDIPSNIGQNVRIEAFVDHEEIFPHISAVITHGGAGTVGRAFRLGVPMLIIPDYGDQISTARRAAELGLAYYLPKRKASSKAIQSALRELLQDTSLLRRIKALSTEIQSMDCPSIAADAIEKSIGIETTKPERNRIVELLH